MDNQVEEVKSRTDISVIIGERIELKKAGRNFKANCPFHGEKTPSFMVSPELQIFKCFGCSEGGDVFAFLEKYEGMEFREALKYLADRAGIKLKKVLTGAESEKEKIIEINSQALKLYNYLLLEHPSGKKALEYLLKERGLNIETIKEFQLGYSPENSSILKKFLVDKKKFAPQDLEKAGIGIVRGPNIYDRFGGRVIFPLFDHRGNPIGFAGRILPWGRPDTAKYINSPDTPAYHKSKVLYALNLTKAAIKKKKIAIIVEGELDAISSYQAGIKNVVAIKGSALTEDQVRLLSRFAEKFILALDSDLAGDAAARRGITIAANLGIEVKVVQLTGFKDPDEAARGNIESYKKDLIASRGVWDYLINSVFKRYNPASGAGKAKISKELMPIVLGIEDNIVQAHYTKVIAERLGVPIDAVSAQIEKQSIGVTSAPTPETKKPNIKKRREMLEDRFLALAFQTNPEVLLSKSGGLLSSPLNKKIIEEYKIYSAKNDKFSIGDFGSFLPKELFVGFSQIMLSASEEMPENPDEIKKELDLVEKELKIQEIKQNLVSLAAEMRTLEENGDRKQLLTAQNKFSKLTKTLSKYEEDDGGGIIITAKNTDV